MWHLEAIRRAALRIARPFIIRCKNLALNIRYCLSLCLSEETLSLKAVGPFYLVSMPMGDYGLPGEVKDLTSLHWKCVTCRGLHILTYRRTTLSTTPVLAQRWAVWSIHN